MFQILVVVSRLKSRASAIRFHHADPDWDQPPGPTRKVNGRPLERGRPRSGRYAWAVNDIKARESGATRSQLVTHLSELMLEELQRDVHRSEGRRNQHSLHSSGR